MNSSHNGANMGLVMDAVVDAVAVMDADSVMEDGFAEGETELDEGVKACSTLPRAMLVQIAQQTLAEEAAEEENEEGKNEELMDGDGPGQQEEATEGEGQTQHLQYPILYLSPVSIVPNPQQPRTRFTRADMKSLTQSMREHGVLQPITVRTLTSTEIEKKRSDQAPADDTVTHQLIAGERRWRAAVAAGLALIPVIVRDDLPPTTLAEIALVENLQRADLDPIEEARGYLRLIREFSLSEARLARRVGRSRQCIRQSLKLLQLPPLVQEMIAQGQLTPTHGHVLRRFAPFPALCVAIARCCIEEEVPATILAGELPNDGDLVDEGLLVYMAAYNTRFDFRRVCPACPHKALWQDTHGRMYCCKPEAWQQKQEQALQEQLRQREDEAARIMAQARQEGQSTVEVEQLSPGSYRDLSSSLNTPPQGCNTSCPCRSTTVLRGREVPVCLNPGRLAQLGMEQHKHEKEARVRSVSLLAESAREIVVEEWREGKWNKVAPLLAHSLLKAQRPVVEEAARKLNFAFPLSRFFDRKGGEGGKWQVLAEMDADQVLALEALVMVMKEAREAVEWSGHDLFAIKAVLGRLGEAQSALPTQTEVTQQDENDADEIEDEFGENYRMDEETEENEEDYIEMEEIDNEGDE